MGRLPFERDPEVSVRAKMGAALEASIFARPAFFRFIVHALGALAHREAIMFRSFVLARAILAAAVIVVSAACANAQQFQAKFSGAEN
jgi:hypothetical protein